MAGLEDVLAATMRLAGIPEPEREYRFHPARLWRFDFAWPVHHLALEVEGGVWARGRHTRGAGYIADCRKYNAAVILGWRVLRATREMIESGEVLGMVEEALHG